MRTFCARALLLVLLSVEAAAQMKLNAQQLLSFVRSSIKLKHPDEQVANYLKRVSMTEQVPVGKIEELLSEGIGPKTYDSLMLLSKNAASLPIAKLPPPAGSTPAAPSIPPPPMAEQRKLIEELRDYSLNYDKQLPDFLCTQVTRRFYDPSGLEYWVAADTVTAKLSYFQQREEKKVLFVNNQYKDIEWDKLGGASSTGEFGALLREIFAPTSEAVFQWERWGTLRGKRNHVIYYRVAQPNSKWTIMYEKVQSITPAYEGRVYADASTGLITRVTLEALDIPASFPVQMARTQLDYDYATISGNTFLLPLRAEVKMREGKLLIRNDIEFRNYRKFGADTSITFDTPEPLASDIVNEEGTKPPKPIQP